MSDLLDRLRDRGWRLTPQRRAVAEVLAGEHLHLSAEAVHLRAQQLLPEVSLATVYNTLNELVSMGEVLEVAAGDGPKRYDPNAHTPHHHLVCTGCGMLRDIFHAPVPPLELCADDAHGYVLSRVEVVYEGLCPDCARSAAGEPDEKDAPLATSA